MNSRILSVSALALLALGASIPRAVALTDAEIATGRSLVKQYEDAIVSVEVVATIKVTVGDHAQPPRENKVEENGTFISSTGLVVTTLSAIDPHGAMEAAISARGPSPQKIEIGETEFKDVKLRLANNTEIPAVIVLKDPDLNLVFVAPLADAKTPARTFPFVALDKSATGEVLGNFFFVTRAPKALQRVPIVRTTNVIGIVEKPRRMYLMADQAPGVPIFDQAGLVLGLSTPYLENGRPGNLIVLTSSDVAELATQAAAIKPEDEVKKQEAAEQLPEKADGGAAGATPTKTPVKTTDNENSATVPQAAPK
jgi:hypothetical protein